MILSVRDIFYSILDKEGKKLKGQVRVGYSKRNNRIVKTVYSISLFRVRNKNKDFFQSI